MESSTLRIPAVGVPWVDPSGAALVFFTTALFALVVGEPRAFWLSVLGAIAVALAGWGFRNSRD